MAPAEWASDLVRRHPNLRDQDRLAEGTPSISPKWSATASRLPSATPIILARRIFWDNLSRLGQDLATDAISQILKEFWPDIKRKYLSLIIRTLLRCCRLSSTAGQ